MIMLLLATIVICYLLTEVSSSTKVHSSVYMQLADYYRSFARGYIKQKY